MVSGADPFMILILFRRPRLCLLQYNIRNVRIMILRFGQNRLSRPVIWLFAFRPRLFLYPGCRFIRGAAPCQHPKTDCAGNGKHQDSVFLPGFSKNILKPFPHHPFSSFFLKFLVLFSTWRLGSIT